MVLKLFVLKLPLHNFCEMSTQFQKRMYILQCLPSYRWTRQMFRQGQVWACIYLLRLSDFLLVLHSSKDLAASQDAPTRCMTIVVSEKVEFFILIFLKWKWGSFCRQKRMLFSSRNAVFYWMSYKSRTIIAHKVVSSFSQWKALTRGNMPQGNFLDALKKVLMWLKRFG